MSNIARIMQQAAAGAAGEALAIEDVFSTYLYTGNGSTQTITNGIDLAGEGGLVWIKQRNAIRNHRWCDTVRGAGYMLASDTTDAQSFSSNTLVDFNVDGFDLDSNSSANGSGNTYASWTFRKAPRFFDVVTYTGDGTYPRAISHNLGTVPGAVIVKSLTSSSQWLMGHVGVPNSVLQLNSTQPAVATVSKGYLLASDFTSTTFTVRQATNGNDVNSTANTYVAYLFAHDPLGPSGDGSDGLIACGSYTGNGLAAGPTVNLGWEPQWLLVKDASGTNNWFIWDVLRGLPANVANSSASLYPNLSNAEFKEYGTAPTPTGFQIQDNNAAINTSGRTYIYIAIRRGPMREPTSGTEVFDVDTLGGGPPGFQLGNPVDMALRKVANSTSNWQAATRLTSGSFLSTNLTSAETTSAEYVFNYQNGWNSSSATDANTYSWMFRRAPGFMDCVAYSGTGSLRTVSHNLGAAPDLMIIKSRNGVRVWRVYCRNLTANAELSLNSTAAVSYTSANFNNTDPTDSVLTVNTNSAVNAATDNYIAYLFATLPGISKVGSYTGNGSNQTINCGFTGGARFVLIKRTDSTGDWYVWDTARGIVAGNDPHLSLNTTAAEVTSDDSIDPDSSGFVVNQLAATNINVSSASYIYLAIS